MSEVQILDPEVHQIILDEMANLQGENVTGAGLAQRVKLAVVAAHEFVEASSGEEPEINDKLQSGIVLIQDGYNVDTLTVWVGELEALTV